MDYSKGVDFDWDLSDKTDTETQTRRGTNDPHVGPADAIVQVFLQISYFCWFIFRHWNAFYACSDGPADCLPQLEGSAVQQGLRRKGTGILKFNMIYLKIL